MNPNDVAFSVIKNKKAMKQAAAQPGQMNLTQPSPQTNLDGESAGLQSEVSQYIQRLEAKQKELEQQEKDRAKYEEERAGMMQPGQQSLPQPQALPQPDQDIQQVVNDNQQELDTGYGFKRGLIEEMEMLGMIKKKDEEPLTPEEYTQKRRQLGDSYADAQMNPDHPTKTNPTSYDMQGKPIQGDREIEDAGRPCEHCGEGHTIYTDDGAVGCSTEDCVANTPEMLQDHNLPHYKTEKLTEQKVGEVTPTRTSQTEQDKDPNAGVGGLAGLFPMAPDPNFEPHIKINAPPPQQISQLVDEQGNPSTTMQGMRHPDIRAGEPMDIAMRLLKAPYDVYTHEGNKKEPFEGTLYAGGDVTDTPKYYTPSLEGALNYAVYGSATGDVPMRGTSPAIRTVQDPGFNEKGQPAGALIADPQLQDAYMQDDDSPLQSELMDDDTLRQLISQMSDKSPKSDTTGYYHSQQDREKHIQGALERLRNKTSGRLDLTDSQKEMGGMSTRRHDELDVMDFDDINSGWDFLEDWEKSWLLNNRFDELPMWLQEEHQDEVKTGEPMDIAMRLLKEDMDKMGAYIGEADSDMSGFRTTEGEKRPGDLRGAFEDTRNKKRFDNLGRYRNDHWAFDEHGNLKFNRTAAKEGGYKDRPELTEIEPGDYMQGSSVPRRQAADDTERQPGSTQTGSYIGADVRGMDDSDKSINRFANTMGHEYTHDAIDGEINDWVEETHGPKEEQVELKYPLKEKEKVDDDDDDSPMGELRRILGRQGREDETKPPLNQKEHDESEQRIKARKKMRTYGHEFGAHQSDKDSREGVANILSRRSDTKGYHRQLAKIPKNQLQTEQETRLRQQPRYTPMNDAMTPQTQQQAQGMTPQTQQQSQQQVAQRLQEIQGKEMPILRSEPMDIAMRLLKEAVSPEAKKHKHDYDTKYESSPERRKYRTELTQERRNRGVAGKGGKDMSHTARGTIVPEDMHANRARHFKERGTLKKTVFVKAQKCPTPSKKSFFFGLHLTSKIV